MSKIIWVLFWVLAITTGSFSSTYAKDRYTDDFNAFYGTSGGHNYQSVLGSCLTCHPSGSNRNAYANDWRNNGRNYAAVEAIDSDDDGFTNLAEINAGYFPGNSASKPPAANSPPVAVAGLDQTINEGVIVTLDGSNSSDPDDGIASYLWTQTGGTSVTLSNTSNVQPTFSSPNVGPGGAALTFRLRVTDNGGLQSTDTCVVNVSWINEPPVANAGTDQTVGEAVLVTLDGSNSSDPDDGIATYAWTQTAGPAVTLSNTAAVQPTFTSPNVGAGGVALTFTLTVTDGSGVARADSTNVNVTNSNLPPVADAGQDQTVNEWVVVTLDGSGSSDPDDGIASYLWQQTGGPSVNLSNNTDFQPTFTAPDVGAGGESLTFELTVTDNGGLKSTDVSIVNVSWVNVTPIADAGPDQTLNEGETVTLDGIDSNDPDGAQLTYLWAQTSGTSVTLSDATAVQPTFVTPTLNSGSTAMTFSLIVEDNGGLQASANVSITVNDNGITGLPADVLTFQSVEGDPMGIKVESSGNITSLYPVDPDSIGDTIGKPENLIFGLIDLEIKAVAPGDMVTITIHLPQPVPEDYGWYQYSSTQGWIDYSAGAVFNADRDQVTLTLTDGGAGDDDGVANGVIVDPSGPGSPPPLAALSIGGNAWGSTGCFIETAGNGFLAGSRTQGEDKFYNQSLSKRLIEMVFRKTNPVHPTQGEDLTPKQESFRTVTSLVAARIEGMSRVVRGLGPEARVAISSFFLVLVLGGMSIARKHLGPGNT
jgi:hypothetical protein